MQRVAQTLTALVQGPAKSRGETVSVPALREVRTAKATYRIHGSLIGADLLGSGTTVLVALERLTPELPSEEAIRQRFSLTRKEARVALLLAEGKSNDDTAKMLSISPHTARHHTERVMLKLGVKSRAEVGPTILRG